MHIEEWNELSECVVCGDAVSVSRDRAFALDDSNCLCFRCAIQRGGIYDEEADRWVRAPNADEGLGISRPDL